MPRNSTETRASILTAARRKFAAEGFQSATVRGIARDVGVDPALVMRYYGSKAELFAAAVAIDLELPDLSEVPAAEHGARLVEHLLARWDDATPQGEVLLTLLRSAVADPAARESMRELFSTQLLPALSVLVAEPAEAPHRVGLVASQMLGLALTRFILEIPPVATMSSREVVENMGPTIQRYLHGPLSVPVA